VQTKTDYYDYNLIAVVILLTGFGLVMLYSTTSYSAAVKFGDDMVFFRRQAFFSVTAVIAALVLSRIPYRLYYYLGPVLYAAALSLPGKA
jgi:cell division protein FtsW